MQTRAENLASILRSGEKPTKLAIVYSKESLLYPETEDGKIIYHIASGDEVHEITTLLSEAGVSPNEIKVEFHESKTFAERSVFLNAVNESLTEFSDITALKVAGTVEDYVLKDILKSKAFSQLTHLKIETGYADKKEKIRTTDNQFFEKDLVAYLSSNEKLQALTINDMYGFVTSNGAPKLRDAVISHPRLIEFNLGLAQTISKTSLQNDSAVKNGLALKRAQDSRVVIPKLLNIFEGEYKSVRKIDGEINKTTVRGVGIYQGKNIDPWVAVVKNLKRNIKRLYNFKTDLENSGNKFNHNFSEEIQMVSDLIAYNVFLHKAASISAHVAAGAKNAEHNDEIKKFWDITFPKIHAFVRKNDFKKCLQQCDSETKNLDDLQVKCGAQIKSVLPLSPEEKLDASIRALDAYGTELMNQGYSQAKYEPVKILADGIRQQVNLYRQDPTKKEEAIDEIDKLIKGGKSKMRNNRRGLDILANVAICLTVVGLVVLSVRFAATGKFFVNRTEREKKLKEIRKDLKKNELHKPKV